MVDKGRPCIDLGILSTTLAENRSVLTYGQYHESQGAQNPRSDKFKLSHYRRPSQIDMGWMVCQYSRTGPVSSEKHQMTAAAGGEWRSGYTAGVGTVTVGMGDFWTRTSGWRSAASERIQEIKEVKDALEMIFV